MNASSPSKAVRALAAASCAGVAGAAGGWLAGPVAAGVAAAAGCAAALVLMPQPQGAVAQDNAAQPGQLPLDETVPEALPARPGDPLDLTRAALEAAPAPVIIVDAAQRVVASNKAARERFAFEAMSGEAGSTPPARFAILVRRPELIEAVEDVLGDGRARTLSFETRVPVQRFERAHVSAFESNSQRMIMVTVSDDTEARATEQMRADFLANASHELRTPLAGILGFIETLRGPARDDPKAQERFLEIMQTQAERMARLISDLLSLSRIEINERVAPTGRADLAAAAQEAVDALQGLRGADVARRVRMIDAETPHWVIGDWDELQQIVSNLVDNALKYGRGDAEVRISLFSGLERDDAVRKAGAQWEDAARLPLTSPPRDRGRRYAVIRVEDSGPGIERQHLPRLAERFYRVDGADGPKPGTGLGLAIVKHIANRHRGGLMVESRQGGGTAFAVYLPQPADL